MSIALFALSASALAFLVVWYFEIVLWIILGPFAITTGYVASTLWSRSVRAHRAVGYWAAAIGWLLMLVLLAFKDVTAAGAALGVATAILFVLSIRTFVRHVIGAAP